MSRRFGRARLPLKACVDVELLLSAYVYCCCDVFDDLKIASSRTPHQTSACGYPCPCRHGEEAGVPFSRVERSGTSRVLHRNNLIARQSLTFADCVSRLFVCGWCSESRPCMVPPTVALPHLGCLTNVPRLIPSEIVPP